MCSYESLNVALAPLQVWNPSFDVTPAALLTGIITEHGTICRTGASFAVGDFLQSQVRSDLIWR